MPTKRKTRIGRSRTPRRAAIPAVKAATAVRLPNRSSFLEALATGGGVKGITIWPEKKKRERWVEPEGGRGTGLGPIIDRIRREKKKYELELPIDPRLPVTRYRTAASKLAKQIEKQIGTR